MISAIRLLAVGALLVLGFSPPPTQYNSSVHLQVHDLYRASPVRYQQDDLKLAVTEVGYDDIGLILDSLGFGYDTILNSDLVNYELIKQYDVIFINCSYLALNFYLDATKSLEKYVREGGKLYASDYAYNYVTSAFPGYINFYDNAPYIGQKEQTITAKIVDQNLQLYLSSETLDIYFDLAGWVPIESVSDAVHVFLTGDIETMNSDTLTGKPLSVSFPYGSGFVLFTSYHSEVGGQPITTEQQFLLQYLVQAATAPETVTTPFPQATPYTVNPLSEDKAPSLMMILGGVFFLVLILGLTAIAVFLARRKRRM